MELLDNEQAALDAVMCMGVPEAKRQTTELIGRAQERFNALTGIPPAERQPSLLNLVLDDERSTYQALHLGLTLAATNNSLEHSRQRIHTRLMNRRQPVITSAGK